MSNGTRYACDPAGIDPGRVAFGASGWQTRGGVDVVREPVIGTPAGAVGPVALNAAAYAGMVVRGRPASGVAARVAGGLLEKAGIGLSGEGEGCKGDTAQNRGSGLGALSGYVVGLGLGVGYGLIRSSLGDGSKLRVGFVPGLAAMAGSETPAAALGRKGPETAEPQQLGLRYRFSPPYGPTAAVAREPLIGV